MCPAEPSSLLQSKQTPFPAFPPPPLSLQGCDIDLFLGIVPAAYQEYFGLKDIKDIALLTNAALDVLVRGNFSKRLN